MRSNLRISLILAVTILVTAFSAFAQTKRPDFNRPQTFDVQNYTVRVSFDRDKKKVFGDTTVSIKPLKANFNTVELDAVDLSFVSVKLDPTAVDLKYRSVADKVVVTLDRTYGVDESISIRFVYSATPKKGVYFRDASTTEGRVHSSQIWSQGEADEARNWIPSFDFPSDKATSEEFITAERDETVIGNGELLGKSDEANGKVTWHYKMSIPHSTYLISFVIGKYVRVEDQYKDTPLGFYVYPGKEKTAKNAFGDTKKMIAVYEELTGVPFPYNKYDQTIVSQFQFGGMENITATTMNDDEIFFADFDFGKGIVVDLVSHELAHSWFGDLVTCRNWAELWLNEGFATYMEAAYREKAYGREDYIRKLRIDRDQFLADDSITRKRYGLFNLRAGDVGALFDNSAVTYNKGGVVVHMLREQVGTEAFWKAINLYLNRHKFANAESSDLKKAMEEVSGQDLGWFFDQWVYSSGVPKLDVKQTYNPVAKTLTLTVTQTQIPDAIVPAVFRLPLDVVIKSASGNVVQKLDITKRLQSFSIKMPSKPTHMDVDPEEKVMLKKVKLRSLVSLK